MKNKNWFWGGFFLVAAIFVIASQIGSFGHFGFLSIAATVLLAGILIHSIVELNYFGIFMPLAFLYMIYTRPLNLIPISPWMLLLSAVLASIGFSCIFRKSYHKEVHIHDHQGFERTIETMDDNNPYAKVHFGASSKYLHADCLRNGQFFSSFGALEVFFDQAQLSPEGAEIALDCNFGAIKLYIPKHWRVVDNLNASLGGIDNDTRFAQVTEDSPRLTLVGNVHFSGIEIKYI